MGEREDKETCLNEARRDMHPRVMHQNKMHSLLMVNRSEASPIRWNKSVLPGRGGISRLSRKRNSTDLQGVGKNVHGGGSSGGSGPYELYMAEPRTHLSSESNRGIREMIFSAG